jgi:hypothetical protein
MKKVFLGGTCNKSNWRDKLIPMLKINYFNPVVDNRDDEAAKIELQERKNCDYVLYVITPKMTGVYSIAEVVDDSNKQPEKTILCILGKDSELTFSESQLKSLKAVIKMVTLNGAKYCSSLKNVANYLNAN